MLFVLESWHQQLINLPTSPVSCSHFTLEIQKVIFELDVVCNTKEL